MLENCSDWCRRAKNFAMFVVCEVLHWENGEEPWGCCYFAIGTLDVSWWKAKRRGLGRNLSLWGYKTGKKSSVASRMHMRDAVIQLTNKQHHCKCSLCFHLRPLYFISLLDFSLMIFWVHLCSPGGSLCPFIPGRLLLVETSRWRRLSWFYQCFLNCTLCCGPRRGPTL